MRGSFDEKCPHCRAKLDLDEELVRADYSSDFTIDCPKCGELIQVDVHSIPSFEVSKGKTDAEKAAEYHERRAKLLFLTEGAILLPAKDC